VGTTASGTAALPNTQAGVVIQQGAMTNTIGGTASGAGNVVSGNLSGAQSGVGIVITGTGTMSNAVQGNLIGLGATLTPLPNLIGVFLFAGASNNTVGGTASGAANTIAYNGKGVVVGASPADAGATGNAVRGNSIYSNQALGIDLGNDGVTSNGPPGRSGPNRLQKLSPPQQRPDRWDQPDGQRRADLHPQHDLHRGRVRQPHLRPQRVWAGPVLPRLRHRGHRWQRHGVLHAARWVRDGGKLRDHHGHRS